MDIIDLCDEGYTGPLCAVCYKNYGCTGYIKTLTCGVCTDDTTMTIAVYSDGFFFIALLLLHSSPI